MIGHFNSGHTLKGVVRLLSVFALTLLFITESWAQVPGYAHRIKMAVNSAQVSGTTDLSNFPILVDFTDPDLRLTGNGGDVESPNGFDIIFTSSDGSTVLNHQLESYNASTGRVLAWVRIPTLSATTDTEFFIYYGNSSISADQSTPGTWDNNYQMVHHYNGNLNDGTSNGNDGTNNGTVDAAAQIGNGRQFDASDFIQVADDPTLDITGEITMSMWINPSNSASGPDLITKGNWDESYSSYIRTTQVVRFLTNGGNNLDSDITVSDGTWFYITLVKSSTGRVIYIDGAPHGSDANTVAYDVIADPLNISSSGFPFNGLIDEVRVSDIARSADWVATEYNNQNSPGTFISEIPEPPVLANIESNAQTFNAGGAPVVITSSITVDDPFDANLENATVQITGNYVSTEDVLAFSNTANITGSFDSGTGTMTLTGTAPLSEYQNALRSVTYENTNSSSPDQSTRTISFTVNDGRFNSNTITRDLNILTDINDPSTDIANVVFHFDGQDIDGDLVTNDQPADGSQVGTWGDRSDDAVGSGKDFSFSQGTASLQPIFDSIFYGERGALQYDGTDDQLGYSDVNSDTELNRGSYSEKSFAVAFRTGNSVAGLQMIYEQGGGVRGYQISIKDGNAYAFVWNSSEWQAGDQFKSIDLGPVQPNESYIVVASHDATDASLSNRTWSAAINGGSPVTLNNVDVQEAHAGNPTISGEDGTVDPVTFATNPAGTNNFNGFIAELVSWNTALNGGQMADVFTFLDDKWSNEPPQLANIEGTDLDYTEGDPPTQVTSTLTVSDNDNTVLDSAYVTISTNFVGSEDQLSFTPVGNITGSFDSGTGRLTLIGQDTKANYESALRSVTYENTNSVDPSTALRQVDFEVFDWDDVSNTVSRNINVIKVNSSPSLSGIETTTLSYTEGDGNVAVTSSITTSDIDDTNLESATIQITNNYFQGEDFLNFTDTGSITGSFDAPSGTLTLTGTATLSEYETALRSVTYENDSPDPVTLDRTVSFTVNDGDNNSNTQSRDISVTAVNSAPILNNIESTALVYSAGDPPTEITNSLTVDDFDNSQIQSATVQITSNYDNTQDVLAFSSLFGITGSFDSGTGTLTLTGPASVADFETALRTVTYENTSSTPSTPTRTVSFTANDGSLDSNVETRDITVSIPASISGLELWLKADAGITASGSEVVTWADQSGNSRDFTGQAQAGTRPTFVSSSAGLNSQPAVEFAGDGDFMEDADGENYINGLNQFTLFVVKKSDITNTDRGFWNTQIPDNEDDIFTYRYDANGANAGAVNLIKVGILNNDPANQLESFSDVQTTNGQITMLQWESGNVFDLYVDGVLNNPSGQSTPPTGTISNATTAIVGKGGKDHPNTTNQSWDGQIAEVILYGRVLTESERKSVEDYISEKYDIPIRLLTPATGGEAISADDANTTFTSLTGPIIREEVTGKLQGGETITLSVPGGYEWDTGGTTPTATVSPAFGGSTDLQVSFSSRTASEITFTIDQESTTRPGKVEFGNLRVRPTTGVLSNEGNITNTGTTGPGGTTNYGTLTMVAGVKDSLVFAQQPTNNNVNENISPAVRVQLVDQFGNIVEESGVSIDIALTTGTGTLSGTTTQSTNILGIAEFADLQIDQTGTGKKLTASSTGLNSVESNPFDIVIAGQFTKFKVERVPSGNITPKTAGQNFDIKISAVDANDNVDTDFEGTVQITSTGTLGAGGGTTANFVDGVLSSHTVSITSVGDVKIIATNSSGSETGESNEFPVSPGAADETTSTITASPQVILNDGSSTSTITVQLKDEFGNNLTSGGDNVTLNTDNGTLGSVTDNSDGTYTATLTSSTSEVTATITGTVNSNAITDDAQVEFAVFNAIWESQLGDTDVASDWNDPDNWSSGAVPGTGDIILIPATPAVGNEYPVVDITNQTVGEVSIETGADITVSGGVNFVVEGNLTGGGEVNGANNDSLTVGGDINLPSLPIGTVQLNGTSKQTITSPHTYTNLALDNASGADVTEDLFINGTLNLANGTLTIPSGKNIIANTKTIGSGNLALRRIVSGQKGWRAISSPVSTTYADFLDNTITQGYPGAFYSTGSLPGDTLQPNVLYYDETFPGTDNQRWRAPSDASDTVLPGRGHFVFFFGDVSGDPLYNDPLPDTLEATGQEHEGDGTEFNFNVTYTASADTGWNFVGNPFGATLNWDAAGWTKTNIDNTIYVWDPAANGGNGEYLTWNGSTGTLGSGLIAPYQGFWIKANGSGAELKVQKTNKTTGGIFIRENPVQPKESFPIVKLRLEHDDLSATSNLSFGRDARSGKDPKDAYRLLPFTDTFLEVFTSLKDGTQMATNNLPKQFENRMLVPLYIGGFRQQNPINGVFTLTWPGMRNIPSDWVLTLIDKETGEEIDMLAQNFYTFDVTDDTRKKYTTNVSADGTFQLREKADKPSRFTIRVSTQEIEASIPPQSFLKQNYPNPFNPETTIAFGLNNDTDVSLVVYDILGRKVQTLISERLGAGNYEVNFNGSGLASGVYIYRLIAGDRTFIKKFTLIK